VLKPCGCVVTPCKRAGADASVIDIACAKHKGWEGCFYPDDFIDVIEGSFLLTRNAVRDSG
jgi:hypothetical protein